MMTYLIFPTRAEAIAADRRIALNFGMGDNARDETTRYQSEKQQLDGSWYLMTPPDVVISLPPVFTSSSAGADPQGDPVGTWSYPVLTSDNLVGVTIFAHTDTVDQMPMPVSDSATPESMINQE